MVEAYKARCREQGKPASESGIAMILAVAWGLIFLMLAIGVVSAVSQLTRSSGSTDNYYSAYAAAQAGIDDYIARLNLNSVYWMTNDPTNKGLTTYVPVPGGTTDETYTYSVDTSTTASSGNVIITSIGKSGNSTRRLRAILRRQATIDYVFFSDYQTQDPYMPGAYGDLTTAQTLCENRYWWTPGPVGPRTTSANGTTRNNNYCEWAEILNTEKIAGDSHTNDVWFFGGNLPSSVSTGTMSSSCPPTVCPTAHNWIDGSSMSGPSFGQTYSLSAGNVPSTSGGISSTATTPSGYLNPVYTVPLPLPTQNLPLKQDALNGGCLFTGPTRILLLNNGTMQVTSPDTKSLSQSPHCTILSGGTLQATTGTSQPTVTISTTPDASGYNGVIYVQSIPTATTDPNYWATGTAPSCLKKNTTTGNTKPYVIPSLEASKFTPNTGDWGGFPSPQDNSPTTPTTWFDCTKGDIYLQGALKGQLTLASENNIGLTGSVYYADAYVYTTSGAAVAATDPNYGSVPLTSTNTLALAPNNYVYNYNPINTLSSNTDTYKRVSDWPAYKKTNSAFDPNSEYNVVYDFSMVAINHCYGTMNPSGSYGLQGGGIYLFGSLGQKYRCIVGVGSMGYTKHYTYDKRLRTTMPPYLQDISMGHWHRTITTELTPN
jgi:hypothetical protein